MLNKRNKAIRFADKSPAGWTAVEEYESDKFADDSEDEKKLRSAERRALSNWLRAREQNGTSGQNRFKSQFPQEASHAAGSPYPSASQPFRPAGNNFLSSPFVNSHFGTDNHSLPTNVSPVVSSGIVGKFTILPKLQSLVPKQSLAKYLHHYHQQAVKRH